MTERRGLGRGLSALLDEATAAGEGAAPGQRELPIEQLHRNAGQPRMDFNGDELNVLAESIRDKGVLQPILVRPSPGRSGEYQIVAGERRWRAAQIAGLTTVPVVLRELDDLETLEIAIIENVQRSNLNALEEALGYDRLAAEFGYSQSDLAKVIGKSRPHVANTLRLLKLPEKTRAFLSSGALSAGHARALLSAADPDGLAEKVVSKGLSVRDVEKAVQREAENGTSARTKSGTKDADTRALEKRLSDRLGLTVEISHKGEQGEIKIRYTTLEQLDRLVALLGA
jgi:ParB family chromosome partitioning protein